jgi:hypothetical protein
LIKPVVSASGHTIEELKRKVHPDKLLFGVSGIATWKVEKLHNRIDEKAKCEIVKSTLWISTWSWPWSYRGRS